jgi:hypothetical protein
MLKAQQMPWSVGTDTKISEQGIELPSTRNRLASTLKYFYLTKWFLLRHNTASKNTTERQTTIQRNLIGWASSSCPSFRPSCERSQACWLDSERRTLVFRGEVSWPVWRNFRRNILVWRKGFFCKRLSVLRSNPQMKRWGSFLIESTVQTCIGS